MVKQRAVWQIILFSIITLGLYGIYWFVVTTNDIATLSGDTKTSGGMALLFTIITFGIYGIYWYYKMGKLLNTAHEVKGLKQDDKALLFIILAIFGLGIISIALIQSDINSIVESQTTVNPGNSIQA